MREIWNALPEGERREAIAAAPRDVAEELFLGLPARDMCDLLHGQPPEERRSWIRLLPPDDAADLIQCAPQDERAHLLHLLDEPTRKEVVGLLAYREDEAGGLMSPRYVRLRPEMHLDEAIAYLRRAARERLETIYYIYVLDLEHRLVGVLSFRELFGAPPQSTVRDVMRRSFVSVPETMHQEAVARVIAENHLLAVPVLDAAGHIKGIVTIDDIVDVLREEATEDIQKLGGMEALDAPYLQIAFARMVRKRASWLAALFLGEMLTATAMAFFEDEIARAVVLALFVPLIISSGGNSGSQASTLVIRAMALGEVKLRDGWRVVRRELGAGIALGAILGSIGFLRIVLWQAITPLYGEHYLLVALTVSMSLVGVVTFGTLAGSLLPFVLRRLGFDPASASAPFVATLVDVTGLLIYFGVAFALLRGTLL
ncbi:MAG TPA: magnesium transporter [Myxococcota bacterium]|nr:magnesium transporter [Myxococcota bacterium]